MVARGSRAGHVSLPPNNKKKEQKTHSDRSTYSHTWYVLGCVYLVFVVVVVVVVVVAAVAFVV